MVSKTENEITADEQNQKKEELVADKINSNDNTSKKSFPIEPEEEDGNNNDETVGFDVDVESDPNLLTFKSDEYLASEKVTETFPNSKVEVFTN